MSELMEQWMRLCELLDDDADLAASVRLAVTDPADGADPWERLIDGLDEAGVLAYLDRNDTGMELADALAGVPRVFASGADVDPVGDIDGELSQAISRADEILAPHGLQVVYVEEDSDAYPLVIVPVSHAAEIVALAKRLGHTARRYS